MDWGSISLHHYLWKSSGITMRIKELVSGSKSTYLEGDHAGTVSAEI